MQDKTLSLIEEMPRPLSDLDAQLFCEQGFIAIDNYFDSNLLARVTDEWLRFTQSEIATFLPKNRPAAVFWRHVQGDVKRIRPLEEFEALSELALGEQASSLARQLAYDSQGETELRLLETIVFSKPPNEGGLLSWHQDSPFFPFDPQNQIALWIPLDDVDASNGGLEYAVGSHKTGSSAPFDLHSGKDLSNSCLAPLDCVGGDFEISGLKLRVGGAAVHDGRTWHRSLPNNSVDRQRRAISLRYLVGQTRYAPRQGTASSMNIQVGVAPGEIINSPSFPLV
jgi:ectoine hydroxylase-related dioxygenase (phytanoyl-CoA dioxygenase family)